jgi:hypothetical protein
MIYISPLAYQKIVTAQGFKTWEVGFYGITDDDDITRIHDVFMPEQECHDSRNEFNEMSVSNYAASYLKKDYSMRQLLSVWIHTHPGKGKPAPSKDDKEMFDRIMEQCGNVGLMLIASENDMRGWLRVKPIQGLKRTLESVEEVTIDWTMDTANMFRFKKWKKRHDKVVSLLPTAYVAPTGSSSYQKCLRCQTWKPMAGDMRCSESTCYTSIRTLCQECRDTMGSRCLPCWMEHLKDVKKECEKDKEEQIRAEALALVGPSEEEATEGCTGECKLCTIECDARGETYDPTAGDTAVDVKTCDGVCAKCPYDECNIRNEAYAPSEYCDTKCADCLETFCYDRDETPVNMNCTGDCGHCTEQEKCEYALSELIEEAEAEAEYQLKLEDAKIDDLAERNTRDYNGLDY